VPCALHYAAKPRLVNTFANEARGLPAEIFDSLYSSSILSSPLLTLAVVDKVI